MLSVRAEARQLVAPDYAVAEATIEHTADSKAEAVQSAASAADRLTADLAGLGGMPFDQTAARHPLTWSTYTASTSTESYHDKETGRVKRTGQVTATLAVRVTIRDLDILDAVSAVLTAHQSLNIHSVSWKVDWDNPAWSQVRADAIRAAIGKAGDYAAALGVTVQHIEHVADAGLLGGAEGDPGVRRLPPTAKAAMSSNPDGARTSALEPVPLELTAVIDARVRAARGPDQALNRANNR
jgi:uncharacterized protein